MHFDLSLCTFYKTAAGVTENAQVCYGVCLVTTTTTTPI